MPDHIALVFVTYTAAFIAVATLAVVVVHGVRRLIDPTYDAAAYQREQELWEQQNQ